MSSDGYPDDPCMDCHALDYIDTLKAQLAERDARIAALTAAGDAMAVYLETEEHNYACGTWKGKDCTCGLTDAIEGWQQTKEEKINKT